MENNHRANIIFFGASWPWHIWIRFRSSCICNTDNENDETSNSVCRRLFEKLVKVRSPEIIEKLYLEKDYGRFVLKQHIFLKIPGNPIAYWLSNKIVDLFENGVSLNTKYSPKTGMTTGDDERFLRQWHEPSRGKFSSKCKSTSDAKASGKKWFPYNKGGIGERWFGNCNQVVNWENDGTEIKHWVVNNPKDPKTKSWSRRVFNHEFFFGSGITWTLLNMTTFNVRYLPNGSVLNVNGPTIPVSDRLQLNYLLGYLNSKLVHSLMHVINPTVANNPGSVGNMPLVFVKKDEVASIAFRAVNISKSNWDSYETSWNFVSFPLLTHEHRPSTLAQTYTHLRNHWRQATLEMQELEEENNRIFIDAYGLQDELTPDVPLEEITLTCNPHYRYAAGKTEDEYEKLLLADTLKEFISYAVGCMFGRYSLDKPGLILANQGESVEDYVEKVPSLSFAPDKDNVIPILDQDWFMDDMAGRFHRFLRITFGKTHYEENLAFIEEAIGKDIRKYFLKDFYKDHLKRYKKRPIYWLFSSPETSFNALIYIHRYRPDTVSVVLNDYLREFRTKLVARREHMEQISISASASSAEKTRALKEIEKLKKTIDELENYERDTLYPLAAQKVEIDLDDGVKVNYKKFGKALKKVPGVSS